MVAWKRGLRHLDGRRAAHVVERRAQEGALGLHVGAPADARITWATAAEWRASRATTASNLTSGCCETGITSSATAGSLGGWSLGTVKVRWRWATTPERSSRPTTSAAEMAAWYRDMRRLA
jgi:hypothetical protein